MENSFYSSVTTNALINDVDLSIQGAKPYLLCTTNDLSVLFDATKLAVDANATQQTSLSGIPDPKWVNNLYSKPEPDRLHVIEECCRRFLADVKATVEKAESLPAFMSIFSMIGNLSSLAYSNHPAFLKVPNNDGWKYMALIDHYVLGYNDETNEKAVMGRKGLADILYRNIRCGLLHGGSLVSIDKKGHKRNEQIAITLSHKNNDSRDLKTLDKGIIALKKDSSKSLDITIGAPAMYDAIDKIIVGMFHGFDGKGADSNVLSSIQKTYREAPFVVAFKN